MAERKSGADGFASYCAGYDKNQRDLQERAMAKKPQDIVTVSNGPGITMDREDAESAGLAYVPDDRREE